MYDDEDEGSDIPQVVQGGVALVCIGTIVYVVGGLLGFW